MMMRKKVVSKKIKFHLGGTFLYKQISTRLEALILLT